MKIHTTLTKLIKWMLLKIQTKCKLCKCFIKILRTRYEVKDIFFRKTEQEGKKLTQTQCNSCFIAAERKD